MSISIQGDNLQQTAKAGADINGQGITGKLELTEFTQDDARYVHVRVEINAEHHALPAGRHAVHFHEHAIDGDDFKSAGGHFDPGPNGNSDPDANHSYHSGDLPSIEIDEHGHGVMECITTRVTLSDGPVSLLGIESAPNGTSIMIHGNHDPHTPGESGSGHSGGPRMAAGTIFAVE